MQLYPPDGHDFVPESEVRQLAKHNQIALRTKFAEDLAIFRADVALKLRSHDAFEDGVGWAIFIPDETDEEGSMLTMHKRDIFVVSGIMTATGYPNIRIIANELMSQKEDGSVGAFMTQDFTADQETAHYHLDMFDGDGEKESHGMLFQFSEGSMRYIAAGQAYATSSPVVNLEGTSRYSREMVPLGRPNNVEDKIAALAFGRTLLDEIMEVEPVAQNYTEE